MDKKRIGSFVIGGVAGLLAGILIAPKSGRETRGSFADRAGEARQKSSETYFDARERLRERVSAAGEDTTQTVRGDAFGDESTSASDPAFAPEPPEPPRKPVLRDVSLSEEPAPERSGEPAGGSRPDELRRRIRETRQRIRDRGNPDNPADVSSETPDGGADDPR